MSGDKRGNGIQEVAGSIPVGSTNQNKELRPTQARRLLVFVCRIVCNPQTSPFCEPFMHVYALFLVGRAESSRSFAARDEIWIVCVIHSPQNRKARLAAGLFRNHRK
jgi:hypothetical protein